MPQFVFLWTDTFVLALFLAMAVYTWRVVKRPALRSAWASVARTPSAMCAAVFLVFFLLVGLLDSIHYRPLLPAASGQEASTPSYAPVARSALDDVLKMAGLTEVEKTYSAPLARFQLTKESMLIDGKPVRDFPRLVNAGVGMDTPEEHQQDILQLSLKGLVWGLLGSVVLAVLLTLWGRKQAMEPGWGAAWRYWWQGQGLVNWRLVWFSACVLVIVLCLVVSLSANYYVLGTDRTGNDIIWQALKSVRTALVIGTLTTFAMLPPAIILGLAAGYFRGWVDDVIQYIYTTLTSIPGVLLIAACVLMMQVYIDTHPDSFDTVAARADLRLFMLCLILGLTGWAGLCRLLRAEVLKLRELDYVQAAQAFGVGHLRIMFRHLLPNVMHIVLITLILEFSGLVLYEAVLSYLGIGVDPSMPSFGRMIDAARSELSRDPIIWWGLAGAFVMMLGLVLSANIFADAVQTAFDPRTRRFKALRLRRTGGAKV
ncbi:peptide ABC transporter permease [Alcaligenes faecalis]|uniref:ABC transporter permease n=1 Tax=Alcaligenes faecalis TaxID=511 RepID=UPI000A2D9033|nr:ABC transporter permease [Alcaligenes faecalis]OSZ42623.1 peptide ABC transporter permease [Alcaligenes faecalis]OSZ52310.1 peptide ABC transporter permease [Alcaligenes faecalis]OSZ54401.1 peptide ABC transporter permease [Alcaligenes faecalis]